MSVQTLRLDPRPASVPEARRFLARCLEQWGLSHICDTVLLLTSEIVSNSVLHARTEIVVSVDRAGDGVRIGVTDGSAVTPVQRRHAADSTTGRGVQLLDQLAASWNVTRTDGGKTVRFTVSGSADPWAAYGDAAWREEDL